MLKYILDGFYQQEVERRNNPWDHASFFKEDYAGCPLVLDRQRQIHWRRLGGGGPARAMKRVLDSREGRPVKDYIYNLIQRRGYEIAKQSAGKNWEELIDLLYPDLAEKQYKNDVENISEFRMRSLDKFILKNRVKLRQHPHFRVLSDYFIQRAMLENMLGFAQTVLIVVGEEVLRYPDFVERILEKKHIPEVHRTIYNKLREKVPEARDYVGPIQDKDQVYPPEPSGYKYLTERKFR